MLATKPVGSNPPCNLAAATTGMMWACALATARVTVASTARGLDLWTHMLRGPAGLDQNAAPPASTVPEPEAPAAGAPAPADPIPFASYRSSGGHASTQVIVSN